MKKSALWVFALSMGMAAPAMAQTVPDSGQLLNQQQQRLENQQFERLEQPSAEPQKLPPSGGPAVMVKRFHFTGIDGLATDAELQSLLARFIGQKLDFAGLQAATDTVTAYLRKQKGWPLAQAYLPKQDVTNGNIEIAVTKGRIESNGAVITAPAVRLSQNIIKKTVDGALPANNATPSQADLERAVLLINDMPGMKARSTLERGSEPGTTRYNVNVEEGPWVTGSVDANNFGNRYTGTWAITPTVNLNDPLGIGDQLTISGTNSEGSGLRLMRLGYSLPVGTGGLRLFTSYSRLLYQLDATITDTDSNGLAETADVGLTYPVIRSRAFSLWTGATYTHKALRDKVSQIETTDRSLNNFTGNISASATDAFAGGGMTSLMLAVTSGDLDRSGNAGDLASDQTTARSDGRFVKATASAARLQRVTDNTSVFGTVRGQIANKNLDSSEKFILGGPAGIRAYPIGEASGDDGWLVNLELRYDVPAQTPLGKLQLLGFVDMGGIRLNHDEWTGAVTTATGKNEYTLSGAGIGANISGGGLYELRTSWAHSMGGNPGRSTRGDNADGRDYNQTFWVQGLVRF